MSGPGSSAPPRRRACSFGVKRRRLENAPEAARGSIGAPAAPGSETAASRRRLTFGKEDKTSPAAAAA
jgi:hypothetical protein